MTQVARRSPSQIGAAMRLLAPLMAPWLWMPVAALALTVLFAGTKAHRQLGYALHDVHLRLFAQEQSFDALLVLDIDDESLRALQPTLGAWPFKRDFHRLVVDYLREAGANAVVYTTVFGETIERDDGLRESVGRGRVVLAASALVDEVEVDSERHKALERAAWSVPQGTPALAWPGLLHPNPSLLPSNGAPVPIGLISLQPDEDGYLRRVPLLHKVQGLYYPSLALAALYPSPAARPPEPSFSSGRMRLGAREWPVDKDGRVLMAFAKNASLMRTMAFVHVARAALGIGEPAGLRQLVDGRTVFIGSSAYFPNIATTPVGPLAGVALTAQTYEALKKGYVLKPSGTAWDAFLLVLALLPAWLAGLPLGKRRWRALILGALVLATLLALDALLYLESRQQVELVLPMFALSAGMLIIGLRDMWHGMALEQRLYLEREAAESANRAKSEFLANMSHEIRTPMNALLGMAQMLANSKLDTQQERYVGMLSDAGGNLLTLVSDLIEHSKIEAGQFELSPIPFSLREMLQEQYQLLNLLAKAKSLDLFVEVAPDVPDGVYGDRKRLAQVLVNLVGNAIKFTGEGQVRISVRRAPQLQDGYLFSVADQGIGIGADKLEAVFEPFVQADASVQRKFGGTGLGLAITKRLVQMMGGRVWVESELGQGSTFFFTSVLPQAQVPRPEAQAQAGADALAARAPMSILLAEDNPNNVFVVQSYLKGTGDRITVAADGREAVDMFAAGKYDLVLMDMQMPLLDGISATREIRVIEAQEGRARTPIVALTANALAGDAKRGMEAGVDDYLTKPIAKATLLDVLAKYSRFPVTLPTGGTDWRPGAQSAANG